MPAKNRAQERVARYYQRQTPEQPAWGDQYRPAIKAVREEAPGRSRPTIIHAANKLGRPLHLLSQSEVGPALLALYHPGVFDIHEQRVLDPAPTAHPLHGHPTHGVGQQLEPLPGTWAVAERLQYVRFHPKFTFVEPDGTRHQAPHPLVGDLLVFVESGADRRAHCVNWDIKAQPADFTRKLNDYTSRQPRLSEQRAVARHAIERSYYEDAGIRTVELASSSLAPAFVANLKQLFFAASQTPLRRDVQTPILDGLQDIVGSSITPIELLNELRLSNGIDHEDFRNILLAAIWRRELRVDLFERILFDRPLRPEKTDVLERYAAWFSEDAS